MPTMGATAGIDYEGEGLLDGLAGSEREQRVELLDELEEAGFGIEELRSAIAEDRLALLAVERRLGGPRRYTPEEVADLSGVELEQLERQWRALGMALAERDEPALTDEDLEGARRVRRFLEAGLDPDAIDEVARVIAVSMSQFVAANRRLIGEVLVGAGDSELELARRLNALTEGLLPTVGPALEYAFKLHLREQLRHGAIDAGRLTSAASGVERTTIAFADLVGFTRLGEQLPPEELGHLTGSLDRLARDVAITPVRLVKLIGDAVMLAAAEPEPVIDAILSLVEAAEAQGDEFPALRGGVATGEVLSRAGDLYGRPVNLASRVTSAARPGSVLVTEETRDALEGGPYRFSNAGEKRLKGIGSVRLYRCRRSVTERGAGEAS
jgi:adenylate cyclase